MPQALLLPTEPYPAKNFSFARARVVAKARATSRRDFRLQLELSFFRPWQAGQFVMLRWGRHLVGRPFAIVDWRPEGAGSVMELWIRRLGAGTEEIFSTFAAGEEVAVSAPLGRGLETVALSKQEQVLFLSGGVGAASILPLVRARKAQGLPYLWAHGERHVEDFDHELDQSPLRPQKLFFEEGGDAESRGRITRLFEEEALTPYTRWVACGPSAMLEALTTLPENFAGRRGQLWLGLEEKMGCGVGLCFSCSVLTERGPERCCLEGPWFLASDIPQHFEFRRQGRSG